MPTPPPTAPTEFPAPSRLVLPVARADPFAQLVRPGQLHDGRRTASGDRLRRPRGPAHALLTRLILLALTRSRRAANMAPEPLPVSIGPVGIPLARGVEVAGSEIDDGQV